MNAQDIVTIARTFIGVPFRHQGRSRYGLDCAGLVVETWRAAGCLPEGFREPKAYGRLPSAELIAAVERYCTPTTRADAGTLVLIRWTNHPDPSHLAICTGDTLIHAYQIASAVIENGYRGAWLRDTHSLWRMPGVRYE